MKVLVALVGESGSGKGTFAKFLRELLPCDASVHSSSAFLAETLKLWNIPLTRENLQKLPTLMEDGFGRGAASRAMLPRIKEDPAAA